MHTEYVDQDWPVHVMTFDDIGPVFVNADDIPGDDDDPSGDASSPGFRPSGY